MTIALAPSVGERIADLRRQPWVQRRIAHEVILPAQPADLRPWPERLHPELVAALTARGLDRAYSHQAEAIEAALDGRDVTMVTPTASGKTLGFVVPVLDSWLRDPDSRSLWLFPTKALAQDQLAGLRDLVGELAPERRDRLRAATFDGDTPTGLRRAIREGGHIVVTNPDMLHSGILPHHTGWAGLLRSLRYIVIDELHAYRGLFGSHLANVLRRLLRICRFYGSNPTVICCSATIGNPGELAGRLLGRPVTVIDRNGAPRAERHIWFWAPPLSDATLGVRRSAVLEARRLIAELLRLDLQVIGFCRSRSSVEVLLSYLRQLDAGGPGQAPSIRGYRGGYLPLERRAIEAGLRGGSVRAVVATNALELGVDIGGLDASVLVGYPGTLASTWQQLGRAGRRGSASLGVFIASDSPLDQFLLRHPEYLLETPPERGLVDPDNLLVLGSHLQAAAFELSFAQGEAFGNAGAELTESLLECFAEDGLVHRSGSRYHWSADAFPAEAISLRRAAASNVVIIDTSSNPTGPGQGPQGPWAGSGGGRPGSHGGWTGRRSAPTSTPSGSITTPWPRPARRCAFWSGSPGRWGRGCCAATARSGSAASPPSTRRSGSSPMRTSGRGRSTFLSRISTPPPSGGRSGPPLSGPCRRPSRRPAWWERRVPCTRRPACSACATRAISAPMSSCALRLARTGPTRRPWRWALPPPASPRSLPRGGARRHHRRRRTRRGSGGPRSTSTTPPPGAWASPRPALTVSRRW